MPRQARQINRRFPPKVTAIVDPIDAYTTIVLVVDDRRGDAGGLAVRRQALSEN